MKTCNKKSRFTIAISVFLVCVLTLGFLMFLPKNLEVDANGNDLNTDEAIVWVENSTEKIKRQGAEINEASTTLNLSAAKGEYEGGQIIISAKKDLVIKDVKVTSLKNGMAVISKDLVSVYYEKYFTLTTQSVDKQTFAAGDEVPDALLPYAKAVEYGENTVEKEHNQGIYVEVEVPSKVAAGQYEGSIVIETNRHKYEVPFKFRVYDYDISGTATMANYWGNLYSEMLGTTELNSTDEMYQIYFESLLKYRMVSDLPFSGLGGPSAYVELIRKYYNTQGFSAYRFYYELGGGLFNQQLLIEYFEAVAKASVEDRVNYLSKAFFYFSNILDEPHTADSFQRAKVLSEYFIATLKKADESLKSYYETHEGASYYYNTVSPTLLNIKNVVPESIPTAMSIMDNDYGITQFIHCPAINYMNSEVSRNEYFYGANKEFSEPRETWWYTCTGPVDPFPSNHLNDDAYSFRMLSWMGKKYDISGYLNWAVAFNLSAVNNGYKNYNPYEEARNGSFGIFSDGDGFMVYPGAPYGIEGPIGSLRAANFRDGVEDYESICLFEKIYEENGVSAQSIMDSFYEKLFVDVIPTCSLTEFLAVRDELAQWIELSSRETGVIFHSIETNRNIITVEFETKSEGAVVKDANGAILSSTAGVYCVTLDTAVNNVLKLYVTHNGKTEEIVKQFGGLYVKGESFENSSSISQIKVNAESTISDNTNKKYITDGDHSVKITVTGKAFASSSFKPYFALPNALLGDDIIFNAKTLFMSIYNDSNETRTFSVYSFNGSSYELLKVINLLPGNNEVSINFETIINRNNVRGLYFMTDNILDYQIIAGSFDIYIDNIAYFK